MESKRGTLHHYARQPCRQGEWRFGITSHVSKNADQIWALSVTADEKKIVSGAGDSIITIWEDVTAEKVAERENERTAMALQYVFLVTRCA
jgi:hypothetical protein